MAAPLIAKDIRDYLVNTVGLTSVFIDAMTSTPVAQYAVVEFSGLDNIKTHGGGAGSGVKLDEGMVQVQCRNATVQTARTNIMAVVDALDGKKDTTINSVVYTYMTLSGRPRLFEKLEDGSCIFIAEFRVQARRA